MEASVPSTARPGAAQATVEELDVGALGRALWRKKILIIGLTLLAASVAFIIVNLITPRYKSEARVLIETRDNIFLRPEAAAKTNDPNTTTVDPEAVTSQVQLILSRDLARDIIAKFKLGELPEFDPVLRGASSLRTILAMVGIGRDPMTMTPEERVLKSFQDRLNAFQVEKSRVIVIEFESEDQDLAARVTNAIAEQYLALQQAAKQDQTRSAGQWLAGEIEKLRAKVADAEAKVERYRSKANLLIGTNNATLSTQQLGDFNAQLSAARAQKADAETKARFIREALRNGGPIEFSDITNSELMRRLSEQRVTLRAQLAEQSSTLLDNHPRIKELRAQISDLEKQMRTEAERLARSLENDSKLADSRMVQLNTSLDQLKQQASTSNEQDVELRALERDAKSQRDLLESYLAKYRETTARDSINATSPDARIISTATVSNTPSWPKKLPTILVATLAMFALSAGFVLTGELLTGLPTQPAAPPAEIMPSDIAPADSAAAPAPAAKPRMEFRPPPAPANSRVASGVPLDAVERLARELATTGEGARRITVVGAVRNIGTTLAAITLARSLSSQGRVVLVDLALGSPNLSVIASDPSAPGIAELVRGTASFGQIITRDRQSRVHLIMAGRNPSDAATIIASQRLSITLEALARSYDHLVIDAGAMPDMAAERFAQLAPRAVLIAGEFDDPVTLAARERLLKAGYINVSVLASKPGGPETDVTKAKAA